MEGKKWRTKAREGLDRSVCVHACQYERRGERDRQRSQGNRHYVDVACVKRSILVKTHSAVSVPLLAIKPYSLVLVTPLMVFHSSLPKDIFLYTHTHTEQSVFFFYAVFCQLKPSVLSGTNIYM